MDGISHRVVEKVTGIGRLYQGEKFIRQVRYAVTVFKKVHHVRTSGKTEEVEGLKVIEGHLENIDGSGDFFDLVGSDPTLYLEDGRRWDCIVQNNEGRVVNGGKGLYRADEK